MEAGVEPISLLGAGDSLRQLDPRWNKALIAASIAISFLGAFTSSQLMCHANMCLHPSSVFAWSMLGSLLFGFCSIWSLHEVAMLAFEFDLPIGINAPLTILSSVLAVGFTFAAIATDMLRHSYHRKRRRQPRKLRNLKFKRQLEWQGVPDTPSAQPLLQSEDLEDPAADSYPPTPNVTSPRAADESEPMLVFDSNGTANTRPAISSPTSASSASSVISDRIENEDALDDTVLDDAESQPTQFSRDSSWLQQPSTDSSPDSFGLSGLLSIADPRKFGQAQNPFVGTAKALYFGCTRRTLTKGFAWSLAVTTMHYTGIFALKIPAGYATFNPWLVGLSALISWAVCTVGCILLSTMETYLPHQMLFSAIAATGVAAMHFTGIAATTFYSAAPPSDLRGYPPSLANVVMAIAFVTCITANVLLAHSATVTRNKLAEIVWTRKELWRTIAQKQNAEAAARARSDFIASASHEIRTPLHHLQGYGDLLARTELTDEGRALLTSIQRATITLSLITNNVLDWSKFERSTENSYQPTDLDIRAVCESLIVLLPNLDEDTNVELFVVVSPHVPSSLYLDETWIHRILMNLLSNALKFTRKGYIFLSIEVCNDELVFIIRDTGCGLDPTFIPDMWTPFKQGEVRGSARGTGLGLSIIKQLLHNMNGRIAVKSDFALAEDIGPERSGTTFTVTLPLQSAGERPASPLLNAKPSVAILAKSTTRHIEGLVESWRAFNVNTTICSSVSEIDFEVSSGAFSSASKYVWAEIDFLFTNVDQFDELKKRKDLLVLVPYATSDSLEGLAGIMSSSNFVLLPKPLIWHALEKRIANVTQKGMPAPHQALRFAPDVKVIALDPENTVIEAQDHSKTHRKRTVLLVEDNPINQRLGEKMLASLNYEVVIASDGAAAIDLLLSQKLNFEVILMDQSMPRMDGVAATKKIRALEKEGKLKGRTPIIALTAVVNSDARHDFRKAGAEDFLAKPLGLDKLRDTLRRYIDD